jgi:hypothetical protein
MEKTRVPVELLSEIPSAVESTARTIATLHPAGSHRLVKEDDGYVIETDQPDFVRFAAVRQGYVKALR